MVWYKFQIAQWTLPHFYAHFFAIEEVLGELISKFERKWDERTSGINLKSVKVAYILTVSRYSGWHCHYNFERRNIAYQEFDIRIFPRFSRSGFLGVKNTGTCEKFAGENCKIWNCPLSGPRTIHDYFRLGSRGLLCSPNTLSGCQCVQLWSTTVCGSKIVSSQEICY